MPLPINIPLTYELPVSIRYEEIFIELIRTDIDGSVGYLNFGIDTATPAMATTVV